MDGSFSVQVECYAGYRAEQRPRRFRLGTRTIMVEKILDQWLGPDYRYFKLQGDDGATYILRHDEVSDRWQMTMFDSGGGR